MTFVTTISDDSSARLQPVST